jgi:hypothetical protein
MVDQEVFEGQLKTDRFPFPSEGNITLAVRISYRGRAVLFAAALGGLAPIRRSSRRLGLNWRRARAL